MAQYGPTKAAEAASALQHRRSDEELLLEPDQDTQQLLLELGNLYYQRKKAQKKNNAIVPPPKEEDRRILKALAALIKLKASPHHNVHLPYWPEPRQEYHCYGKTPVGYGPFRLVNRQHDFHVYTWDENGHYCPPNGTFTDYNAFEFTISEIEASLRVSALFSKQYRAFDKISMLCFHLEDGRFRKIAFSREHKYHAIHLEQKTAYHARQG